MNVVGLNFSDEDGASAHRVLKKQLHGLAIA